MKVRAVFWAALCFRLGRICGISPRSRSQRERDPWDAYSYHSGCPDGGDQIGKRLAVENGIFLGVLDDLSQQADDRRKSRTDVRGLKPQRRSQSSWSDRVALAPRDAISYIHAFDWRNGPFFRCHRQGWSVKYPYTWRVQS